MGRPRLSEKEQSLLGFFSHQVGRLLGNHVRSFVIQTPRQELKALHTFHCIALVAKGEAFFIFCSPEVYNDLLCLVDVQDQIVANAPLSEGCQLCPGG